MSYRYSYDAIGNVTGIADLQQGAGFDRSLQYDAGQRLVAAGSASFGGDHWHRYSYDARDNLLSASLGGVRTTAIGTTSAIALPTSSMRMARRSSGVL